MPLKSIRSGMTRQQEREVISDNITTELAAGKKLEQARAIALSKAREDRKKIKERKTKRRSVKRK